MIPASTAASAQEGGRIFHFYKVIIKILVPSIYLPLRLGGAILGSVPIFSKIEDSQRNLGDHPTHGEAFSSSLLTKIGSENAQDSQCRARAEMVRQNQTKKKLAPSLRSMTRVQTKKPKRKILFILKILSKTPTPPSFFRSLFSS